MRSGLPIVTALHHKQLAQRAHAVISYYGNGYDDHPPIHLSYVTYRSVYAVVRAPLMVRFHQFRDCVGDVLDALR